MRSWLPKNAVKDFLARISEEFKKPFSGGGTLLPWVLVIGCLGANVCVRLFPAYFPGFIREAVLKVVDSELEAQFKKQEGKEKIKAFGALAGAQELIHDDPEDFSKKVDAELAKLKEPYQDERGLTYLMESDPYAWAVWTKNILRYGHPGDKIVNGKSYDSAMLAPIGLEVFRFTGLFYLTAFLYKGLCLLTSAVSFEQFLFFIPVFYAACFFCLLYLFVRKGSQDLTAFFAVLLSGCMNESIQRGSAGWYDFDMLSLFLALTVAWSLLEAVRRDDPRWGKLVVYSALAAFLEGLYAKIWMGWWFMLVVAAGFFVIAMIAQIFSAVRSFREAGRRVLPYAVAAVLFLGLSHFFAYVLAGVNIFENLRWLPGFLRFNTAVSADIWPNVFYTISELNALSLRGLMSRFYGPWIFLGVCGSVVWVIWREWRTARRDVALMLMSWFLFMLFASFKGNRFVVYLAVPSFVFFSVMLVEYIPAFIAKRWAGIRRVLGFLVYLALIAVLVKMAFQTAIKNGNRLRPSMNDAWYQALTKLDKDSPPDAIVNSWWDYGSWFRYYGRRGVVFDGQSQGGQVSYWMARVLLEKDESRAVRILAMLNRSGTRAFSGIAKRIGDPFRSKALLDRLLEVDEAAARELLAAEGFTVQESMEILQDLFGDPSPAYFIVEGSLQIKISSISFLGNWDFRKLLIERNKGEPKEKVIALLGSSFGLSAEDAANLYEQQTGLLKDDDRNETLSERLDFSSTSVKGIQGNDLVRFDNGVVLNVSTREVLYYSEGDLKFRVPKKVVFWDNGVRSEVKNEEGDGTQTVLISLKGEEYRALIASEDLVDSLFVKLYFLDGSGLKHFKPFHEDKEHGISIYRIDWKP